jgi:hypothetical protein
MDGMGGMRGGPPNGIVIALFWFFFIFAAVWPIIVLIAGIKMLQGQSWGLCLFGSIWAMMPCSYGCLLGIPIGIWAIVVLNNDQVKRVMR